MFCSRSMLYFSTTWKSTGRTSSKIIWRLAINPLKTLTFLVWWSDCSFINRYFQQLESSLPLRVPVSVQLFKPRYFDGSFCSLVSTYLAIELTYAMKSLRREMLYVAQWHSDLHTETEASYSTFFLSGVWPFNADAMKHKVVHPKFSLHTDAASMDKTSTAPSNILLPRSAVPSNQSSLTGTPAVTTPAPQSRSIASTSSSIELPAGPSVLTAVPIRSSSLVQRPAS